VDPTRCAVVEDTVTGVRAGVSAGATVFGYAPLGDGQALLDAGASVVFRDMLELPSATGIFNR
jgi:beta-phosphoglucomutase-like phosphatase (HAD superfamily)